MRHHPPSLVLALAAGSLLVFNPSAQAAVVFTEDFNSYVNGNQNSLQFESGLKVSHSGDLPGWIKAGGGVVHAVDRDGAGDYSVMLWQDNVITLSSGIPANDSLAGYTVEFSAGPAVYAAPSQVTGEADGIVIEVLRPNNSVLARHAHKPGAWAGAQTFAPGSFQYVGDGSGPVRLRIGPLAASGHFAGAIDDLSLSKVSSVTPPGIAVQPTGGTVLEGGDFILSVESTGPVSFQWRKDEVAIPGATSAQHTLKNAKLSDAGSYTVLLANASGTLVSDAAVVAVTAAPIFATYAEAVLRDNPIHYYPLDETTGTEAADLGSLAVASGLYTGGFTLGQPSATPRLGTCLRLDGQPGSLVDLGLFHPGDSISVEAWANLDSDANQNPAFHVVASRWDGSWEIDYAPGDVANFNVRRDGNGFGQAAATAPSTRGTWHHLVLVFSEGKVTGYVDGVQGSEVDLGGVLQDAGPSPDRVMIGATRSGTTSSFNWKGLIDEVAIYDYALTPVQVRGHYRASVVAAPALTIQNAVIVSWPGFPAGYVLQSASDVNGPYQEYTGKISVDAGTVSAAVPVGSRTQFFRLVQP